jgi:hypothetical protein
MVLVSIKSANILMAAPRGCDTTYNAPGAYSVAEEL